MNAELPEQASQHADDISTAKRVDGLTTAQLIDLIGKHVSRIARSSKQVYAKWKGPHDLLTAEDIRDGLARDADVIIPLRDTQVIVSQYGGPLSLSSFVRLLGDGAKYGEQNTSIEGVRRATEDDATLTMLADGVTGSGWENLIMRGSPEDISRGFARMGTNVSENQISVLTSKLGRIGFVDAIRARMQ
jgi:hypothetical protein